jgi:tetratricopeptide (TPR) repeat protein
VRTGCLLAAAFLLAAPVHASAMCAVAAPAEDSAHDAIVRRARAAAARGAWNEAASLWRDALLMDERAAAHWLAYGDVLSRAERHREAVAAYQRAMQLDAGLARDGSWNVAKAYARQGDERQAVRWLEQALRAGVPVARIRDDAELERLWGASRRPAGWRGGGERARRAS